MAFERARPIDAIAEQVAGADIVLSSEAPVTLALDRRTTQPRIGRTAATPRSHATGELVPDDRRHLFHTLISDTELPWKTAARALDLCLDCWDRTGSRDRILDYPEFDTPAIRATLDVLDNTPNSYRELATTQLPVSDDVWVLDEPSLTPLDRSLLPPDGDYTTLSPFEEGEGTLPDSHLYPSATAIVDALVDQISAANADRIGVVLDQQTVHAPLVEAALESADIPYQGGPGFVDIDAVRVFLRLLQTSFAGSTTTVGDVRPLLTAVGVAVPRDLDQKRIDVTTATGATPVLDQLEAFREAATTGTFADALTHFEDLLGERIPTLRDELNALTVLERPVTEHRINDIVYYLQSFDVPVERNSEGVLLTDAGSTAYVDRPVVFYLGLGPGWAKTPPDYPWVDDVTFTERDLRRFKLLLQNGDQRYILAQESRGGDAVTPCPYLRTVLEDPDFDTLAELPDAVHHHPEGTPATTQGFSSPVTTPPADPVEVLSQSRLKRLVVSPRDYYFNRLLDTPTNYYMERGTLLHDAAELYVNDPALFTEPDRRDTLLSTMMAALAPYISDARRAPIRTRLDVGLDVIKAYLSANDLEEPDPDYETYADPQHDNALADSLGITLESRICERWFESSDIGGRGVVDLLQDPQTVVDYKSGRVKSAGDIQQRAAIEDVHSDPDFQVLLYLAQHRRERPDERLEMRFVHLLGAVDEMVHGAPPNLDDLVTTLTYVPCTFSEFVTRRAMFEQLTDYADSNNRCKVLYTLGYDRYREFFEAHPLPREGDAPDDRATIKQAFRELAKEEVGDYKYVEKGVDSIFDDLTEPTGYFLEDDIDAFETFLQERLADLNTFRETRFPVTTDDSEPNWDRVHHRDCILTIDD